jgi:pre-mRNA-processing factor 17
MTEHAFRTQHLTHSILGYSQNLSVDPNAPAILGSVEAAETNNYVMLDSVHVAHSKHKELKRKRNPKGNLTVLDGDNAYVSPWASWAGKEPVNVVPEGEDEAGEEESEPEQDVTVKKAKPKRGAPGQETSIFHGKSMTNYQGWTYISPPLGEAPHLQSEPGSQESFIPKVCIHTWTGHTNSMSVI